MLNEPKLVTIRPAYESGNDMPLAAYYVTGTEETLAVHRNEKDRWSITHVPSGRAMKHGIFHREAAEDLASWVWLNIVDREGWQSSDVETVSAAAGAYVRSRWKDWHKQAATRTPLLFGTRPDMSKAEEQYGKLIEALATQQKELEARERAIEQREEDLLSQNRIMDTAQEVLAVRQRALQTQVQATQTREQLAVTTHQQLNRRAAELERLRGRILGAIQRISPQDVVPDCEATRALRRIHFREPTPPEEADPENS